MTDKTIPEIKAEHGARASGILLAYRDNLAELREKRRPEGVEYMGELDAGQKFQVLQRQKKTAADEAYRRTREEYADEVERYHQKLEARRTEVERGLFAVEGSEGAAMLSRAALASEEELGDLMHLAARAKNRELGKAVFLAAERRGLGGLVGKFFDEIDPEARGLYHEWREVPPAEVLDRQLDGLDRIIEPPDHDRLAGSAIGTT